MSKNQAVAEGSPKENSQGIFALDAMKCQTKWQ
jgi:hypothetical protein